jgi:hypothetical protein
MKIAMDSSVIDRFERILRNIPNLTDKEEKALLEIKESGALFFKLPSNIEYFQKNKSGEKFLAEEYLRYCREVQLDDQKIKERINELTDPYEDLEDECKLLAEAEQCGVNVILTTIGNFISELAGKANKVKIIRPTDYFKK